MKCKCPDGFYCIHKDNDECIYPRKKFDDKPSSSLKENHTSLSTADHAQLTENLVDSQSDSATNSKERGGGD